VAGEEEAIGVEEENGDGYTHAHTHTPQEEEEEEDEEEEEELAGLGEEGGSGGGENTHTLTHINIKALKLFAEFLEAPSDEYRNARFKLIPSVVEGPYIIRFSVGNKPVLLGNKLTQRYWQGEG
jgi:hypothetical protein